MSELDQAIHLLALHANDIKWNQLTDGKFGWDWYYAENRLYIMRNRGNGNFILCRGRNPDSTFANKCLAEDPTWI